MLCKGSHTNEDEGKYQNKADPHGAYIRGVGEIIAPCLQIGILLSRLVPKLPIFGVGKWSRGFCSKARNRHDKHCCRVANVLTYRKGHLGKLK